MENCGKRYKIKGEKMRLIHVQIHSYTNIVTFRKKRER